MNIIIQRFEIINRIPQDGDILGTFPQKLFNFCLIPLCMQSKYVIALFAGCETDSSENFGKIQGTITKGEEDFVATFRVNNTPIYMS